MTTLSIKEFPDELLIFLKVKAAQERTTLRSVVIHMVSNMPGAPAEIEIRVPKPRGRRPHKSA